MRQNYQKKLDFIIENLNKKKPTLLLHCCCAPCSTYVLEYLSKYFKITIFYYNPNITDSDEYYKRVNEIKKFIFKQPFNCEYDFIEGKYVPELFFKISDGLENEKEGGDRCTRCYYMRLKQTAIFAKENNFDYFTTTLTISPYKNADKLNRIGEVLEKKYGVRYLYSDFKKKNGYKRSIELSKEYNLYRQDYCGCIYSKREREIYVSQCDQIGT